MNKFFEFHAGKKRKNDNRPYYYGTWEPLVSEPFRLPPFQLSVASPSDYSIYHVQEGVKTDITANMNGVFYSGSYLIYNGSVLDDVVPFGRCHFEIVNSTDYTYYSDDVDVCSLYDWLTGWTVDSGTATVDGKDVTSLAASAVVSTNGFDVTKGESLRLIYKKSSGTGDLTVTLYDSSGVSQGAMSVSAIGSMRVRTITVPKTLEGAYISLSGAPDTHTMSDFEIYKNYSPNYIKYSVSSSVDYGGVKYTVAGWDQWIWKKATVRKSPRVEVTSIGDEKNGELIIEKRTSAVRYVVRMKCTEQEFEAIVHSMSGNVEVIDQTGKTFTANKKEISDPAWYHTNGIVEVSFLDENNINVYTLNNSDL